MFQSSRGSQPVSFADVLINGLADDGGLYSPLHLPTLDLSNANGFKQIVEELIIGFSDGWIEREELRQLIEDAYSDFRHPDLCQLKNVDEDMFLLDLTMGPTLAFKDFALALLGKLLDRELANRSQTAIVLGATSGDTGSAAIEGIKDSKQVHTIMLHPHEKVSDVQRRQMTTVDSDNVTNLAVRGSFDDCQDLVKRAFSDPEIRSSVNLVAVNSINFARILIQIGYYFAACQMLGDKASDGVDFAVPTGNFGNVLAGWYAKRLGAPINKLIVGSNHNNAFHQFIETGRLFSQKVKPSHSPSMDIQIPSNLERLLWEASGRDSDQINQLFAKFRSDGNVRVDSDWLKLIRTEFFATTVDDDQTLKYMRKVYELSGIVIDPHTAVGVFAAEHLSSSDLVVVCETASPAKFQNAVYQALDMKPELPGFMSNLFELEEKFEVVDSSFELIKQRLLTID